MIFSQTYQDAFDLSDNSLNSGEAYSFYCNAAINPNCSGVILDGEADMMHAYLIMYRATRDKKYLDKFIINAKRVQERRDDNIQNVSNYVANHTLCEGISPLPDNPSSKGWSYDLKFNGSDVQCCYGWMPTTLYSGKITFPMAEFIYMIKSEFNEVANFSLPPEANGIEKYINQYGSIYDISENFSTISTYENFADWLYERLKQTIDYHNTISWQTGTNNLCDYDNTLQYGAYSSNGLNSGNDITTIADPNQQCAIGKTLVYLYLVSEIYNSPSYTNMFHDRVVNIAKSLWCSLNTSNIIQVPLPNNLPQSPEGYWQYCHQFNCYNGEIEDAAHGIEEAEFLELCYRYAVKDFNGNDLFSNNSMLKMANTVAYKLYKSPLKSAEFIDGSGVGSNSILGYYGFLVPYNPYIYQELSDIFCYHSIYSPEAPLQTAYLALAQSSYYQSNTESMTNYKFNPVAVRRGHSLGSSVYSLVSGDFDGNGKTDFISVDDQNGIFYVYTPDFSCDPNSGSNCWLINSTNSHGTTIWSGIAAGDFNTTHIGDEFIALDKNTGKIHYFEENGNSFNELIVSPPASYNWTWITSWDFDISHIGDEAIGITEDGSMYMIKYVAGSLTISSVGSINILSTVGIAAGRFDPNNSNPQIATIDNNYPGEIKIFEFTGGLISQTPLYSYNLAGPNNSWTGIVAGDIDGDGVDEIIAHRETNTDLISGQVLVYKLQGSPLAITPVYEEYFPVDQSNRAMCTARFSDFPNNDAIVMLRNYDGQVTIFTFGEDYPVTTLSNSNFNKNATEFKLSNQPNPFDNQTTISFSINQTTQVTLEILNSFGQIVDIPINNKSQNPGNYQVTFDAGSLLSGIYFCILTTENYKETIKMCVMK